MTKKKRKKPTQPRHQWRKSPGCDDFGQVNLPQQPQGLPDRVIKSNPGAWVHSPPEHQILQHASSSASFQDQPCCSAPGSLPDTGLVQLKSQCKSSVFPLYMNSSREDTFANPETHIMHLQITFLPQEDPAWESSLFLSLGHTLSLFRTCWRGYWIHELHLLCVLTQFSIILSFSSFSIKEKAGMLALCSAPG